MQSLLRATFATTAMLAATAAFADPTPTPLSPVACLRKMAMDLTNQAPSDQDYAALSGGKPLSEFVDQYLATPAFSQIMFNFFRSGFAPTDLVPDTADKEEPARIGRHLVDSDGDFRDMVAGNYTVDATGKAVPAATGVASGILTTQSYLSAYTGAEYRNWAGQVIKGLAGTVLIPVSEVPEGTDSSRNGLAGNPACAGCHTNPLHGVDKVAAFHDCFGVDGLPKPGCTPTPTEFLGKSGSSIADLGRILADSVEWRAASIQDFYRLFWGRGIAKNETSFYFSAEKAWLDSGFKAKELFKHIVLSPEYCSR